MSGESLVESAAEQNARRGVSEFSTDRDLHRPRPEQPDLDDRERE